MAHVLAETFVRAADALDTSARLADQHADRSRRAGRLSEAAKERSSAERAHTAAEEARATAQRLIDDWNS